MVKTKHSALAGAAPDLSYDALIAEAEAGTGPDWTLDGDWTRLAETSTTTAAVTESSDTRPGNGHGRDKPKKDKDGDGGGDPPPPEPPAIEVDGAAELLAALQAAAGGETIRLAPGDYGLLQLIASKQPWAVWDAPVTLLSAEPGAAVFTGLDLRGVVNLAFDGVTLDYDAAPGAAVWESPFRIEGGSDIAIRNAVFDGDLAEGVSEFEDGHATGKGLFVRGAERIVLQGNEVFDFKVGMAFTDVAGLLVSGNDLYALRGDGIDLAQVQNARIEGNHIHDFAAAEGAGDHRDMIQMWTTGTNAPSIGVTVRGNLLMSGTGAWTQSVFMRNELVDKGLAGAELLYRDVLIEDNLIWNAHLHGITVGGTDGLTVRNNTLLQNPYSVPEGEDPAAGLYIPQIRVSALSTDAVEVSGNVARTLSTDHGTANGAWTVSDNLFAGPADYDSLIFDPEATTLDGLRLLEGGPGAAVSQPDDTATIESILDAAAEILPDWL